MILYPVPFSNKKLKYPDLADVVCRGKDNLTTRLKSVKVLEVKLLVFLFNNNERC